MCSEILKISEFTLIIDRRKHLKWNWHIIDYFYLDSFHKIVDDLKEIEELQDSNDKKVKSYVNEKEQGSPNRQ